MRRAVARGRVFPQYYSTDRRFGRLSIKSLSLFPLMWTNADDQGRLVGDPEEIKYSVCPNIDHITKTDIPELLQDLQDNELILCYDTPKSPVIQMLDWWQVHKPQWAWPSDYDPPEGWQDHLRYKRDAHTVETLNWPISGERSGESKTNTQVRGNISSPENSAEHSSESEINTQVRGNISSPENSAEHSGEAPQKSPLTTPLSKKKRKWKQKKEEEEEEGNSPEDSAEEPPPPSDSGEEEPSPSPTVSPVKLLNKLIESFRIQWGRVPADSPDEVIPREPDVREMAQLRDLADELSHDGGCPLDYIKQAFREAAGQQKFRVSYVRAVLLDWLGIERNRSP